MRLISLTANKESFRALHFRPKGLSLIVAKQKTPGSGDKTRTYNGVGKSLAIALIHFCLGSSTNEGFAKAIPGWEFTLTFTLNNQLHVSRRNTSTQNTMYLDNEQLSVRKFRSTLEGILFKIPVGTKFITFRPLIKRFIRPTKESYVSFDTIDSHETVFQKLLINGFLLGLDIDMIAKKRELKMQKDRITNFKKNLTKDTIFSEYFTGNKDVDIELKDLEDRIASLSYQLETYKVAENYYDIQQEANDLKINLEALKNKATVIENAIRQIDVSLSVRPDIPIAKLQRVYEEIKAIWTDGVRKRIEEVKEFHDSLLENRIIRMETEKSLFRERLWAVQSKIKPMLSRLNQLLAILGTHGALDEFVSLTSVLGELKARSQKILDYKGLLATYIAEIQETTEQLVDENKRAIEYVQDSANLLDNNLKRFRFFSKQFYPDRSGGITVQNNDGENQLRFDIKVRLQDDRSDGINEVKIFCYDMSILTAHHGHNVNFVFHDSRLYGDIDHRKRATLFKVAHEHSNEDNFQYIATINEDHVASIRDQFDDEHFKEIISDNIVIELTDECSSERLLGIQVELDY